MWPVFDRFRTSWRQWVPALIGRILVVTKISPSLGEENSANRHAAMAMINIGTDEYWMNHALDSITTTGPCIWCAIGVLAAIVFSVIFGAIGAVVFADRLGRHKSLLIGACLGLIPITGFFSPSTAWPWITYFIGETGNIMTRIVLPVYISEIVNDEIRGAAVLFQMAVFRVGRILAGTLILHDVPAYVLSIIVAIIFVAYFFLFTRYPDTPSYFVMKKRYDKAEESFAVYSGITPSVKSKAVEELTNAVEANGNDQYCCVKIRKLFTGRNLRGLLIIILLLIVRINEEVFDTQTTIFLLAFTGLANYYLATVVLYVISFVWSLLLIFIIDLVGRRPVTIASILIGIAMIFSYLLIRSGLVAILVSNTLVHLCQITLCVIPLIFVVEFFPTNIKITATAFVVSAEEIIKWYCFVQRVTYMGAWEHYFFLIVLSTTFILVIIFTPETKKKSYFEIQNELDGTLTLGRLDVRRFFSNRFESQILTE